MNRRLIAILAAVVLAVTGAFLVLLYARSADNRAIAQQQPTKVYIAQKVIPAGTTLKDAQRSGLLVETQAAAMGVPAGALSMIDADNNSLLALSDVQPGEFLLSARFGTTPVGVKAIEVPSGMVAIAVELTDPARVGTFVRPGSRIAIFDSFKIKALSEDPKAKLINDNDVKQTSVLLDDVQVIGVGDVALSAPAVQPTGDAVARSNAQQAPSFLVTVAVTPEQSVRLVHGIQTGKLYAALRGSDVTLDPKVVRQRPDAVQSGAAVTVLWDVDPDAESRYSFALGQPPVRAASAAQVGRTLGADRSIGLVVIGPDIDLASACELADHERVEHPDVGVVLLRHRLDVPTLTEALKSGIREVVPAEDQTALAEAVRRSRLLTGQIRGHGGGVGGATREGRIVTVFSAKGGVGKTTLSTNLAVYLASVGARTLLVDLDLMFGDVAISLQLAPTHSIANLTTMSGHLDPQGVTSVTTRHTSGLDIIAAPSDPGDAERIPAAAVLELLRLTRTMYDYVVVDTPPSFTEHVLAAFDVSDLSVLIATLDIPAVKNLRIAISTLDALGGDPTNRVVVLNRADAKVGLDKGDVEHALHQSISATIPNSLSVPTSINRGVAVVTEEPNSPVSQAIREIADHEIRERFGETLAAAPKRRGLGWGRK